MAFADGFTGVRDSKVSRGPELALNAEAFAAFLDGVKADRLGQYTA